MNPNPHEMKTNVHPARNMTRTSPTPARFQTADAFMFGMIAGLSLALFVVAIVAIILV